MKNKIVFSLLLVFLLIRIISVVFFADKHSVKNDPLQYHKYATAILENRDWLTNPDFTGHFRPPVYPLFLALIYLIFGRGNFLAVYFIQSIISVITCYYIFLLCLRIIDRKNALFALIWSGLYIFYIRFSRFLLRETLVIFLLLIFFFYLYDLLISKDPKKSSFWIFTLSYSLLIHLDPRYLFYLFFLPILFMIYHPLLKSIKKYFIFLGVIILLMIPWMIRNYLTYDGLVLISTRTFNLSNNISSRQDNFSFLKILNFDKIKGTKYEKYPTEEIREAVKRGENPLNYEKQELEAIKKDIYPDSTFWGRKWFHFVQFWEPFDFKMSYRPFPDGRFDRKRSLKYNIIIMISYGLLLPFMLISIINMIRRKKKIIYFLLFPLLIQTILHVILWGVYRYRVPVDAFIIILGTNGMILTYKFLFIKEETSKVLN
ncbi:MAG: glycosyltransferase family 39 protein [Candidatus Cloacimonetes bacterium]|nr:glycosyltransferase family 39 protein [Candidatus Cloacimonadota bacterium]